MKNSILVTVLGLAISTSASAVTGKLCTGAPGTEVGGNRIVLQLESAQTVMLNIKGKVAETFSNFDGVVIGRDQKRYRVYSTIKTYRGYALLLADENLLQTGTQGNAEIQWRGDISTTDNQWRFSCKDLE
jgi:hypothetical protein